MPARAWSDDPCAGYTEPTYIWPAGDITYNTHSFSVTDNGSGVFISDGVEIGTVNYITGAVTLDPTPDIPAATAYQGDAWASYPHAYLTFNGYVNARFTTNTQSPTARPELAVLLPPVLFKFGGNTSQKPLVPASLRFRWGTQEYRDVNGDGNIYRHSQPWTTQVGTLAGTIDYSSKTARITDYVRAGVSDVQVLSMLLRYGNWTTYRVPTRAPASNIRPGTFTIAATAIDGRLIAGISDNSGNIAGDPNVTPNYEEIAGTVNHEMGFYDVKFGKLVLETTLTDDEREQYWYDPDDIDPQGYIWKPTEIIPDTIRINCVNVTTLPLAAEELGLDPVRLPSTGKVSIFKPGNRVCIHNTQYVTLPNPAVAGSTINCGRTRISRVSLYDAVGRRVPDSKMYPGQRVLFSSLTPEQQATYEFWQIAEDGTVWFPSTMDLDAGLVELASPLDLTGFNQPLKLYHTIEDSALITAVDLSGLIKINKPLTYNFAINDKVSSQLFWGDRWARYINLYGQATWTGVWSDALIGSSPAGVYNDIIYPVIVTNRGCITERWRLTFTSTTVFSVYGERSGLIATGDINTDCQPTNPATSAPYFFIDLRGWGLGWVAGNTIRFNTVNASGFWAARCVSAGPATGTADSVTIAIRGDSEPA